MLELIVYDGGKEVVLRFEHSLRSVSKWESKHKKAFLADNGKTHGDMLDYFQDMILSKKVDRNLVYLLSPDQTDELFSYIADEHTASSVRDEGGPKSREVVTGELIYAWMVLLEIPFEPVDTWHLNNLMMLIRIINFKKQPEKKVSDVTQMADYRAINAANKKRFNTRG